MCAKLRRVFNAVGLARSRRAAYRVKDRAISRFLALGDPDKPVLDRHHSLTWREV